MKKISCYVENFEPYGYFVGGLLSKQKGKLNEVCRSVDFYNLLHEELETFLKLNDYSKATVEKYFSRPIGLFKHVGRSEHDHIIEEAPFCDQNVLWFQDARTEKISRCKKCPDHEVRCNKCQHKFDGEVLFLPNFDVKFKIKKISCFVKNFAGYGYFIGGLLSLQNGNLNKIQKSTEFSKLLKDELENFFKSYTYSVENVEKYFSR